MSRSLNQPLRATTHSEQATLSLDRRALFPFPTPSPFSPSLFLTCLMTDSGTCMGTGLTGMEFHGCTGYMATGDTPYGTGDGMKPTGGTGAGMNPIAGGPYMAAAGGGGGGGGGFFPFLPPESESESDSSKAWFAG